MSESVHGFTQTRIPKLDGRSSAAQFLEEHDVLTRESASLTEHNSSLISQNSALLSEVTMLREELERSERDRVRLQGFAASLTTRLSVIQETISVAMSESATFSIRPDAKMTNAKNEARNELSGNLSENLGYPSLTNKFTQ